MIDIASILDEVELADGLLVLRVLVVKVILCEIGERSHL